MKIITYTTLIHLKQNIKQLKNSYFISKKTKHLMKILKCLKRLGLILGIQSFKNQSNEELIKVFLKYSFKNQSTILNIHLFTTPTKTLYISYQTLLKMQQSNIFGLFILDTVNGVFSHQEAIKHKIGGKLLMWLV